MLILTRTPGKSIVINAGSEDEIVVTVLEIKGHQVRIGIDAPRHISVNREEIQDRIDAEGNTAA